MAINIKDYTHDEVIEKYLNRYKHSNESYRMRKSSLNEFFENFGFEKSLSKLNKADLIDYFDYLNQSEEWTLQTKKNKWAILKSLLNFCMEYYDDFLIKIPQSTIKWRENHKESESNIDVVLNKAEVKQILDYLKLNHFTYYLIFRIFAETGMRKGELINIDYNTVDLKKRFIKTKGKRGTKIYYISSDLRDYLEAFIQERKLIKTKDKALFISNHLQRYEKRAFNQYLLKVLGNVGIDKNVTCHTFRRTLNTLRKLMGCPAEDRKILINHKVSDVNVNHYIKLNYEQYIQLFDRWNPFNDIIL